MAKSDPQMTAVFNCNLRKFDGNPHNVETPFGKAQIVAIGNEFKVRDDLEEALRDLQAAGRALMEALKDAGFSPEINDAFLNFGHALSNTEELI